MEPPTNTQNERQLIRKATYARDFLIIFNTIFTMCILEQNATNMLWIHFILTIYSFRAKKPRIAESIIHYLTGFAIMVLYRLTLREKALDLVLSMSPYLYYEMYLKKLPNGLYTKKKKTTQDQATQVNQ
jgi:hypothetical protein